MAQQSGKSSAHYAGNRRCFWSSVLTSSQTTTRRKKRLTDVSTESSNRKLGTYGNGDGKDVSHVKMAKALWKRPLRTVHVTVVVRMTPLLPTPDHYLYNLITMTSSEAKRLWRRSIKEHFGCTCVYCGITYELHELTLDHVHPKTAWAVKTSHRMSYQRVPVVIRTKEVTIGSLG